MVSVSQVNKAKFITPWEVEMKSYHNSLLPYQFINKGDILKINMFNLQKEITMLCLKFYSVL